jgi:hypothetical protein
MFYVCFLGTSESVSKDMGLMIIITGIVLFSDVCSNIRKFIPTVQNNSDSSVHTVQFI